MATDFERFKKYCESKEFVPNKHQLEMVEAILSGNKVYLYQRRIGKSTLYKYLKEFLENEQPPNTHP